MVRLRVISLKDTYNRILKLSLYIIIFFIILTFLKNISSKDSIIDVKIDVENNLIALKGAIPGPKGGIVSIIDSVKA